MRTSALYTAVYTRLNVSSVTSLLSQGYGVPAIFQAGRVPQNEAGSPAFFPYITISVPSDVDFSDKADLGGNAIVQVDVWDRSGSAVTLGNIMRAAQLVTVRQTWAVTGFVTCERESTDVIPDPDALTMHGLIRLRVLYID